MLGYIAENIISGLTKTAQWSEILKYHQAGYQLLDVRSESEVQRGAIPGFDNLPVDEIRERKSELKNKNILVSCQVGVRGHTATMLLQELGFNAVNLDGGYLTWSNSPAAEKVLIGN
jgi:rhodanese-related sulfurtransferase